MYAFAPEEIVLEVVNAKKGMHFTMAELLGVFDHFPKDRLWTDHFEDVFISVVHAGNMETAKRLHDAQAESNAGTIPVMTYPNGLNGKPIVSEKKIYPNDPCPCGSGKKYKKCCGR